MTVYIKMGKLGASNVWLEQKLKKLTKSLQFMDALTTHVRSLFRFVFAAAIFVGEIEQKAHLDGNIERD